MEIIQIENLNKAVDKKEIIQIYKDSFPDLERYRVFYLNRKFKQKIFILQVYKENNNVLGFSIFTEKNNLVLIHYIVVNKKFRSNGLGSVILKNIIEKHPNHKIFLTAESNDDGDEIKNKRIAFYLKNNFLITNHYVKEFGVLYKLIANTTDVNKNDYDEMMKFCVGKFLSNHFFKFIK